MLALPYLVVAKLLQKPDIPPTYLVNISAHKSTDTENVPVFLDLKKFCKAGGSLSGLNGRAGHDDRRGRWGKGVASKEKKDDSGYNSSCLQFWNQG